MRPVQVSPARKLTPQLCNSIHWVFQELKVVPNVPVSKSSALLLGNSGLLSAPSVMSVLQNMR